jgi:hypothetical protein
LRCLRPGGKLTWAPGTDIDRAFGTLVPIPEVRAFRSQPGRRRRTVSVAVLKAIADELIHSSAMTVILMTEEPGSARVSRRFSLSATLGPA